MSSPLYTPSDQCPKCGYLMDPGICPECGANWFKETARRGFDKRGLWLAGALALSPFPAAALNCAFYESFTRAYAPAYLFFLPICIVVLAFALATWRTYRTGEGVILWLSIFLLSTFGAIIPWMIGLGWYIRMSGRV